MTIAELHQKVDAREFAEWMAYDQLEPFGDRRADLRSAIVASTLANCHRGRGGQKFYPKDFMVEFDREPQTAEQMQAALFQYAEMHNGQLGRRR